ncbi:hypothetical protein DERP_007838 [Dermatophagoides pteronyssinus]|uniref:Uncharacterized protein n=1 Tax=Dermatophagoides pteronyssinus TaxID=6956 RepID=A0ABQ8ISR0_DERPT|nr:hypothetical protein DERP_007838 [Dermatophagoides pteronyssinus]
MVFQLATKNESQSSPGGDSLPTAEQIRNESKKKLMHNIFYFGFIVAGLRFAASILNDGSSIVKIT